jgi:uncharacterized protein YceK
MLVILAVCSLFLSGCGTFSDAMCGPNGGPTYYRGVWFDANVAEKGGWGLLMVADMPFSAIVDTVHVPFIAYDQLTEPPRTTADQQTTPPLPPANPKQ